MLGRKYTDTLRLLSADRVIIMAKSVLFYIFGLLRYVHANFHNRGTYQCRDFVDFVEEQIGYIA